MMFTEVLSSLKNLRDRLISIDNKLKINEIHIDPPKNNNDELSFLRLVAWGYVLLNENAKIHIRFFKDYSTDINLLPSVQYLRTYMAHNLSYESKTDIKTIRNAQNWFKSTCGNVPPRSEKEWEKCFTVLAEELNSLILKIINNCDILEDKEDGKVNLDELKRRIDKNWDAHKFDSYLENAIDKLGYRGIEKVSFRNKYLASWRNVVKLSDSGTDLDRLLEQKIEADLIDYMSKALPYTINELYEKCQPVTSESFQALVFLLREVMDKTDNLKGKIESIN